MRHCCRSQGLPVVPEEASARFCRSISSSDPHALPPPPGELSAALKSPFNLLRESLICTPRPLTSVPSSLRRSTIAHKSTHERWEKSNSDFVVSPEPDLKRQLRSHRSCISKAPRANKDFVFGFATVSLLDKIVLPSKSAWITLPTSRED